MSDSLGSHGLQNSRLPCPSPTPGACSNQCPSSQWCHPTILSSVVPFSSRLQSSPASGSFPMSQFFASGGQNIYTLFLINCELIKNFFSEGFPGGSAGKESACNAGDLDSILGGRPPREGNGYPFQYSGLENSMDYSTGSQRVGHDWATFTSSVNNLI